VLLVLALDGGFALAPASAARVEPGPASTPALDAQGDSLETPGETDRVSFETDGSQLGTTSGSAAISADGRYVAYRTALVVSGADVGRIMLRDRVAGTTTEVARGAVVAGLAVGVTAVSQPAISGDGRWVAFVAGNPDPAANARTVRLWDRTTGQATSPLGQVDGWTDQPALSGDGRYLAFRTNTALAPSDTNGSADVYVLDRQAGGFDRASTGPGGQGGFRGDSGEPAISSDGRFVAFSSSAFGLVAGSVPLGVRQVYVRDRSAATTRLVSAGPGGTPGSAASSSPSVSAAGSVVAFASLAPNLVPGDTNGVQDAFAWSAPAGSLTRLSVSTEGAQGNGPSFEPSVSGDGSQVAFASQASNLVPGDTNGGTSPSGAQGPADVFVHSLASGRTTRISIGPGPVQGNGSSLAPATDGDGGVVAFESDATDLVAGDTNGARDVFVRLRPAAIAISPDPTDFGVVSAGGTPPAPRTVTISSTGVIALTVQAVSVGGTAAGSFAVISDGCSGRVLVPGASCQVAVGISTATPGQLTAQLQVADTAPGAPHAATLTGLVLPPGQTGVPKIVLSPTVGPTGIVVIVTGTGFVAGQPVSLTWSPGITPQPLAPIQAAPDGTLQAQVLVLPGDVLGPRTLSASSVVNGTPGSPATADFLVVPQTAQPPSSALVRIAVRGIERPLIERR
jgi:Tol biopolymer transport system component